MTGSLRGADMQVRLVGHAGMKILFTLTGTFTFHDRLAPVIRRV
jgi:hypothetical protein